MSTGKNDNIVHLEEVGSIPSRTKGPVDAGQVNDNEAAGYVDPTLIISEADNIRLRRIAHRRVLPLLCLGYLCQALDKGTLSASVIMGWITDVGAVGNQYAMCSTILWCGIILGEPLANQCIRLLPLSKLLSIGIFIWSALLLGLGFATHMPAIYAIRFLLGWFEAMIGPAILAVMVQWYTVQEQPFVTIIWQCMLGTASGITPLLSYAFYHLQGSSLHGIKAWQWLHVTIAAFSFTCSVLVFVFLPDSPTRARFATEDEKKMFVERVRVNNQGLKHKVFHWSQAKEALTDPFTYCLFFLCVFNTLIVGGIGTFGTLLITKAFGFDDLNAQLVSIPIGVMSIISYLLVGYLIRKTNQTCLVMVGYTMPNIIGTIVLLTVAPGAKTKGGLVFVFYLMQVFGACYPCILTLLSRNVARQTKRSITYPIMFIGWAGGNAIAPQIFQAKWAPRYFNSLYIHLALYGCFIATCLITRVVLIRRNRAKLDAAAQRATIEGDDGIANKHAFEDLTDRENPDFRYYY